MIDTILSNALELLVLIKIIISVLLLQFANPYRLYNCISGKDF